MSQSEPGEPPAPHPHASGDPDLDTPNCVVCLHRMEPAETASGLPYWHCDHCGASRVV